MLKVHTKKSGNLSVVCVQGKIVRGETDVLRNAVLSELDATAVVLDLGRVSIIDAGGLGVMLELREHLESLGIEFRLRNVTNLVRQVLLITRLDSVFEISTDRRNLDFSLSQDSQTEIYATNEHEYRGLRSLDSSLSQGSQTEVYATNEHEYRGLRSLDFSLSQGSQAEVYATSCRPVRDLSCYFVDHT
jgi:anti-anti-sigma factor